MKNIQSFSLIFHFFFFLLSYKCFGKNGFDNNPTVFGNTFNAKFVYCFTALNPEKAL